jgi:hypothetical protein
MNTTAITGRLAQSPEAHQTNGNKRGPAGEQLGHEVVVDLGVFAEPGHHRRRGVVEADDVDDQAGLGAARELEHGACRGSSQVTRLAVAGRCRARPVLRAAGPIPVVLLPEAAGRRGTVGSSRWPVKMLPL